jgi:hypothetical protein
MDGMKAISASIVVVAGAILFSVGQMLNHPDSGLVTCLVGAAIGIIGLIGWYRAMIEKSD